MNSSIDETCSLCRAVAPLPSTTKSSGEDNGGGYGVNALTESHSVRVDVCSPALRFLSCSGSLPNASTSSLVGVDLAGLLFDQSRAFLVLVPRGYKRYAPARGACRDQLMTRCYSGSACQALDSCIRYFLSWFLEDVVEGIHEYSESCWCYSELTVASLGQQLKRYSTNISCQTPRRASQHMDPHDAQTLRRLF
jgi:hypothetical protein